jgi:hypothetical protein
MQWFALAILIMVIIVTAELIVEYWQYVLVGAFMLGGILLMSYLTNKTLDRRENAQNEKKAVKVKQLRLRREEKARVAAHKMAQQNYQSELMTVCDDSLKAFEVLPKELMDAEALLDQAEVDFEEGAFAPFWDSVEQAAMRIGHFDGRVEKINHNLKRYVELSKIYEAEAPRFPIVIDSVRGMIAGNTAADRMKEIVRKAQRNFEFASIYEQRKTNEILIVGFTNLAQVLDGIGRRLSESIDELSTQVSEMSWSVNESITALGEQMAIVNQSTVAISKSVQGLQSSLENDAKKHAERHDRALEMLDNIQRRRMPIDVPLKDLVTKPAP